MQFVSGASASAHFINNNQLHLNNHGTNQISINTTPGGPCLPQSPDVAVSTAIATCGSGGADSLSTAGGINSSSTPGGHSHSWSTPNDSNSSANVGAYYSLSTAGGVHSSLIPVTHSNSLSTPGDSNSSANVGAHYSLSTAGGVHSSSIPATHSHSLSTPDDSNSSGNVGDPKVHATVVAESAPAVSASCKQMCSTSNAAWSAPPGLKQITPTSEILRVVTPVTTHRYKHITTIADLSVSEYSPSDPEYNKLLQQQAAYYNDHYPSYYNDHLSAEQNILAFKHFEKNNKINIGINTCNQEEDCDYQHYSSENVLNINNNSINITNTLSTTTTASDSNYEIRQKYKELMMKNPHLMIESFHFALNKIPNNHNKSTTHYIDAIDTAGFRGLSGGMPRRKSIRNTKRPKNYAKDADDGMFFIYIC